MINKSEIEWIYGVFAVLYIRFMLPNVEQIDDFEFRSLLLFK